MFKINELVTVKDTKEDIIKKKYNYNGSVEMHDMNYLKGTQSTIISKRKDPVNGNMYKLQGIQVEFQEHTLEKHTNAEVK